MSSGKDYIFISFIKDYTSLFEIKIDLINSDEVIIKNNSKNFIKASLENPYDFDIDFKDIFIEIVFQNKKWNEIYSIPAKIDLERIKASSKENISLEFYPSITNSLDEYPHLGIGIKTDNNMDLVKVSSLHRYLIID